MKRIPSQLGAHRHIIDIIADVNSVFSAVALMPQFFEIFRSDSTAGVSAVTFGLIFVNSLIWFVYGAHRKSAPLLLSSGVNAFTALGILLLVII